MRAPKCCQPSFDGMLAVFDAGRGAQALRRNGRDGRKGVLYSVMKLFENEPLQFICGYPLLRLDSSLCEQSVGVDRRLFE